MMGQCGKYYIHLLVVHIEIVKAIIAFTYEWYVKICFDLTEDLINQKQSYTLEVALLLLSV